MYMRIKNSGPGMVECLRNIALCVGRSKAPLGTVYRIQNLGSLTGFCMGAKKSRALYVGPSVSDCNLIQHK